MKNTKKIGALICIVLVAILTLTGCSLNIGGKDSNKKETIDKKDLEGYTEYVHSSGVKFSYPSEWKNLGTSSKPVFGDTSTGTSVNYLSESVPKTYNLTSYMSAAVANVKKTMEVVGDIEENEVILNGKDASIIKYTVKQSDTSVVIKQACFLDSENAHILTTATLESNYEKEAEAMDNVISSFMK